MFVIVRFKIYFRNVGYMGKNGAYDDNVEKAPISEVNKVSLRAKLTLTDCDSWSS
jgi:hypothetical protein